jgi:hypothetical protein
LITNPRYGVVVVETKFVAVDFAIVVVVTEPTTVVAVGTSEPEDCPPGRLVTVGKLVTVGIVV